MSRATWDSVSSYLPAHVRDHRRAYGAALLLVVAIVVALLWLRPNPFADHQTIRARFADAGALASVGAEVRIAGTPVGKVVDRRRDGDLALVTMELDEDAGTVRADARAELRPRLLFEGTAYVDLAPGSASEPALGDGVIPAARTRTAVSTADAVDLLDAPTRTALRSTLHEVSDTLDPATATTVNRALGQAPRLVRDLGTVADAARGSDGDGLRRAVAGLSTTTRTVTAHSDDLIVAADAAGRTADALTAPDVDGAATDDARAAASGAAARAGVDGATASAAGDEPALDAALAALPGTLAEVRTGGDAAADLLARARPAARDAVPAARKLASTLDAVRPVLREATPVLDRTAPLVADARTTLRTAAAAAPDARAALTQADALSKTLDGGLLTALEKPTTLGTPAYLSFLGLFAGGGGASRPFEPGQGHFMRFGLRFLTGAGAPVPPCTLLQRASPQLADQLAETGGCQR